MRVQHLVENPTGFFQYVPVAGEHVFQRTSRPRPPGNVGKQDTIASRISVDVSNLNPGGSLGTVGIFAGIPIETVDERSIDIKPGAGPGIIKDQGTSATLQPGPLGAYTLHRIEFPGYVATTPDDPARLAITIRTATLAERQAQTGGQSFPPFSGAVFVVTVRNAAGQPVAFDDPVHLTVQFKHREPPSLSDRVRIDGRPALEPNMYIVCDGQPGEAVDFVPANAASFVLDPVQGTVTADDFAGLTGSDGLGTFGAVAHDYITPAAHWSLYR